MATARTSAVIAAAIALLTAIGMCRAAAIAAGVAGLGWVGTGISDGTRRRAVFEF